jgi:hypothetical protein
VSAQRRSIHPNVPGVPWWGAVMIAVTATAIGFAFDAGGGKELTHVFAALYAIGCIAAVLAVRQSGIFTAVVQPPMILFVSVPGAYFLFHGAQVNGLKDVVINCLYPLIERFPLMLLTSGAVLLIGLARWLVGGRSVEAQPAKATTGSTGLAAKFVGIFSRSRDHEKEPAPKRRHAVNRSKPARAAAKNGKRAEPTRARRARPPLPGDDLEPRRRSRHSGWQPDDDLPRRRSSAHSARNPHERREPYERRAPHDRRSRYDSYEPVEAYEVPARRRPGGNGAAVANGTHHPISRVRYRGSPADTPRSRSSEADSWKYDV